MQLITPPLPIVTPNASLSPQGLAHALPQVQALASAPLTQRAVQPPEKFKKETRSRSNKERQQGGDPEIPDQPDTRGRFINTSV